MYNKNLAFYKAVYIRKVLKVYFGLYNPTMTPFKYVAYACSDILLSKRHRWPKDVRVYLKSNCKIQFFLPN